jgi:hypothetical protein
MDIPAHILFSIPLHPIPFLAAATTGFLYQSSGRRVNLAEAAA